MTVFRKTLIGSGITSSRMLMIFLRILLIRLVMVLVMLRGLMIGSIMLMMVSLLERGVDES